MGTPSITAYWPLGNNGIDLAPGGAHPISSFNGSTTTVQRGPFANKGSRLVGGNLTTDYIDCGQNITIRDKNTASFWIKWVNFQTGADGAYAHNIIARRDPSAVNGTYQVYFVDDRAGTASIRVSWRDNNIFYLKQANLPTLMADQWYHIAAVTDLLVAGNTRFYLNGRLLDTSSDQISAGWTPTPGSTNVRIGYSANAGNNFNGYISEVALIGRLLSADEVKNYYSSCVSLAKPRLAFQPPFLGYTPILTETARAADAIEIYQQTKWAALVEAATAQDIVVARNTTHHPVVVEEAQASDTVEPYLVSRNKHITETAQAADTVTARVSTFWPTLIEEATAADVLSGNFTFFREVIEAAAAADDIIGRIPKEVAITEQALAADVLAFQHTFTSTEKSGTYKLYIDGAILATVRINYRQDYDCTEKVLAAPIRQEYTIWQLVPQKYRQYYGIEMVHLILPYRQNYDLATTAIFRRNWNGGLQAFRYNITQPVVFQSRQYSSITERTRVDLRQRVYYSARANDDYSENMSFIYRVMLDGLDCTSKVKNLSYNYSLEQYTGECSITWADPQMYAQLDPLSRLGTTRIEVATGHYGGTLVPQGQFLIEKRSTEIDASKAYPTTWGRTVTARLAAPHSLPITKTWMYDTKALTIALDIMQLSDPTIQLNWQVTDYDVLGGNFVAAGDEPIALLTRLAEPLGAIVTTNKQGEVVVRYRYV